MQEERARRLKEGELTPALAWLVITTVMSKVQMWAAHHHLPDNNPPLRWGPTFLLVGGKAGWGSGDYWKIADHGYRLDEGVEAAFPGYALVVRWASQLTGHPIIPTEVVVSTLSGLVATVLFWRWMRVRGIDLGARRAALAVFLAYPYSFLLFGIAYNDPFLLPLVLGSMILVETKRPVWAGVVGAMATFTRPNALPLIVALLAYELIRTGAVTARPWKFEPGRMRWRPLGVLLSVGGVAAYSAWLQHHAGDPLYWLRGQQSYGHKPVTDITGWLKVSVFDAPGTLGTGWTTANHVLSLAALVAAVALFPVVWRRLGVAWALLAAGVWVIAWQGSIGFAPAGRYLLPALPLYTAAVGPWLARHRWVLVPTVALMAVASVTLTILFSRPVFLEW